ncbi:MAG: IclR family transcriptional regulator, partial [Streptomycetaceae bacterium]|nr:IclR family transcriptional regulator [Streptomycetaceae bacterium]
MAGDTTGGTLQTLDRGLRVLELLAAGPGPLPTREIAERLGLHRSIAHRLLRTLQDHGLVARTESGFVLWVGAHLLGRQVLPLLQRLARPEIAHLAHGTGHTAFLTVRSGDEVITLVSVEVANPRVRRISEPGTRHPVDCGAPGLALLACEPPTEGERPEVVEARRRGYALSSGEVVDGLSAVAMALP